MRIAVTRLSGNVGTAPLRRLGTMADPPSVLGVVRRPPSAVREDHARLGVPSLPYSRQKVSGLSEQAWSDSPALRRRTVPRSVTRALSAGAVSRRALP